MEGQSPSTQQSSYFLPFEERERERERKNGPRQGRNRDKRLRDCSELREAWSACLAKQDLLPTTD